MRLDWSRGWCRGGTGWGFDWQRLVQYSYRACAVQLQPAMHLHILLSGGAKYQPLPAITFWFLSSLRLSGTMGTNHRELTP